MAKNESKKDVKKKDKVNTKENIYLVLNLVLAVVTMALVAALLSAVVSDDANSAPVLLGLVIFSQILFQCLLFVVKDNKKDRIRVVIVGIIYIVALVLALVSNMDHYITFYITNALVLVALAVNQFLLIGKKESKKGIVTNILLGLLLIGLAVATLTEITEKDAIYCNVITAIVFLIVSFKKILFPTLKLEKMKLLLDILVKTHTIDVLICLLAFMVAFSFILPKFEPDINNFWDGMWYCFTVITTIGFGDMVAVTRAGRLLTVVLGIYGIVVVAILTSVIVNFYNEVSAQEKARDFIE